MTIWKMLLWYLLALAVMVLLCLGAMLLERKFPDKKFDERQKQVRNSAYRLSFALATGYQLILFVLTDLEKELPLKISTMIFLGVLSQLLVCHIYCLLNHAALPLSDKAWGTIFSYLLVGIGYLIGLCSDWELYQRIGATLGFTEPWEGIWLKMAIMLTFFVMAALHLIAYFWKERE